MRTSRHPQAKPAVRCASTLPSLSSKFASSGLMPARDVKTSPQRSRLPDISSSSSDDGYSSSETQTSGRKQRFAPQVNLCKCGTCQVLSTQGCQSDIHKNGNKLWYVMHCIVENLSSGPIDITDSARIWATMFTIVETIKCQECKSHSNRWLSEIAPSSGNLPARKEEWMFTVWKHHDDASKRVRAGGWVSAQKLPLSAPLSWGEYLQNYRVQVVTCDVGQLGKKVALPQRSEVVSLEVRY